MNKSLFKTCFNPLQIIILNHNFTLLFVFSFYSKLLFTFFSDRSAVVYQLFTSLLLLSSVSYPAMIILKEEMETMFD